MARILGVGLFIAIAMLGVSTDAVACWEPDSINQLGCGVIELAHKIVEIPGDYDYVWKTLPL
jgi:hypothetical protein